MPETEKQRVGKLGEEIACKFLVKQGFTVVERNYWKKYGEIDIVAKKEGILHFIEVKSVSRRISDSTVTPLTTRVRGRRVTSQGDGKGEYRPEDNLHAYKLRRLGRAIQVYLEERQVSSLTTRARDLRSEIEWQVDAITVLVDEKKKIGRVEMLENIVI